MGRSRLQSGIGGRNGSLGAGIGAAPLRKDLNPGCFQNTYFLESAERGSGTGLVQQTVQIVASHDL